MLNENNIISKIRMDNTKNISQEDKNNIQIKLTKNVKLIYYNLFIFLKYY